MSEPVLTLHNVQSSAPSSGVYCSQRRIQKPSEPARWRRTESWEYRILFAITFCVFLVAAVIESFVPRRWVVKTDCEERRSIIQRAIEHASICVAYAFMG